MARIQAEKRNEDGIAVSIGVLKQRFGERLSVAASLREQHGHTTTWLGNQPPDAVVFAESTEDVRDVVQICADHRTPVIAFGTGSSLEGHLNAPFGGISVDLSRMNRVVAVHAEDLDCVVEPGVTRKQLNAYLHDQGLFFPIDPGADASLGGMASTRASGTNAVRYGTMKDNVLNLTAVMPDGSVIKTANRARKTAAGYDLTRLLIGSEGTLGIITELTLRLQGIPQAMSAAVCSFPDVESACRTVIATIQYRNPGGADRASRRAAGQGVQRALASRPAGEPGAFRRVPWHAGGREGAGRGVRRDRRRVRRRPLPLGDT